jgi:hypothetical protein
MAVHAVNSLRSLGEYEFINTALADFALEAMGMVGIITGHDGLVENGELADVT